MKARAPGWEREKRAESQGYRLIAGLDEAGRGALAGPVVAAAVVLDAARCPEGIRDSKGLTARVRERLFEAISASARAIGIGLAEPREIDRWNVLEATRRAMLRAIEALPLRPDYLILDAVRLPASRLPGESPVKADRDVISVAAASILAKVTRDRLLCELDLEYPCYGFGRHKGYGTAHHFEALAARGPCPAHRRSFAGLASQAGLPYISIKTRTRQDADQ